MDNPDKLTTYGTRYGENRNTNRECSHDLFYADQVSSPLLYIYKR